MSNVVQGDAGSSRLAAALIGFAALLEVVLITHHPIAHGGRGPGQISDIEAVANANLGFHSILMIILVGQSVGLALLARVLHFQRPIVLAGIVLCGLSSCLLLIAMTFDGFVTHELIGSCSSSAQACASVTAGSLQLVLAIISSFSKIGFAAQCLGFAAFSAAIWSYAKRARFVGIVGGLLALAPLALIALDSRLGPSRLLQILGFLAVWGFVVAVALVRGMLNPNSATSHS